MDTAFIKDPDLGVIWGNHPEAKPKEMDKLRKIITAHKHSAFAYIVSDLGNYSGSVGPFKTI